MEENMKTMIFDVKELKKFSDDKPHKETLWSDDNARINLINVKPGQEIKAHVHGENHIWIVIEGSGEYLTAGDKDNCEIGEGKIFVVPTGVDHGIRNAGNADLVLASISV
jgi:mannose-6-phosphate isomerase-like protein (cupin superfamily)